MAEPSPAPTSILSGDASPDRFTQHARSGRKPAPLADCIRQYGINPAFWKELVAGYREIRADQDGDRVADIAYTVRSDIPLLGLAAAAAVAEDASLRPLVPFRAAESRTLALSLDSLDSLVKLDMSLRALSDQMPAYAGDECVLMLGGGAARPIVREDIAYLCKARDGAGADESVRHRFVCLLSKDAGIDEDYNLALDADDCAEEVLARVVLVLGLPTQSPCTDLLQARELIARIVNNGDSPLRQIVRIVEAISSEGSNRFNSLANQGAISTNFAKVKGYLDKTESHPRHAASLFVASNFPNLLAPAEFSELADLLSAVTPGWHLPPQVRQPTHLVTDDVLKECLIDFATFDDRAVRAVFKDDQDILPGTVIDWFDHSGALLKARYAEALAGNLTLGHPVAKVADAFLASEVAAIREIASPQLAIERLRRTVFGYSCSNQGVPLWKRNVARYALSFMLSIDRTQGLIDRYAADVRITDADARKAETNRGYEPALSVGDIVQALSKCVPDGDEANRPFLFHQGAAAIFWNRYVSDRSLDFADFVPWTTTSDDFCNWPLRREVAVALLRGALFKDQLPGFEPFGHRLTHNIDSATLRRILLDLGTNFEAMNRIDAPASAALIAQAGVHCVERLCRGQAWQSAGAADPESDRKSDDKHPLVGLAEALLSPTMRDWLTTGTSTMVQSSFQDHGTLARDYWSAYYTMLEMLVAPSAYGKTGEHARSFWLGTASALDSLSFSDVLVWGILRFGPNFGLSPAELGDLELIKRRIKASATFLEVLKPLTDMFPVAVLMAVTMIRDDAQEAPRFEFAPAFRTWLRARPDDVKKAHDVNTNGSILLMRVASGFDFIMSWNEIVGAENILIDDRETLSATRRDRIDALEAFRDALFAALDENSDEE